MADVQCLDAGGESCPCLLATRGCPTCPPLSGGDCDCDWRGICVLVAARAGRNSARMPTLITRVRAVAGLSGGCGLVHVDWPAAALPRSCSYCLVSTNAVTQAAPVVGTTESVDTALVLLMKGELPLPGERLEVRGPFPPNGPR